MKSPAVKWKAKKNEKKKKLQKLVERDRRGESLAKEEIEQVEDFYDNLSVWEKLTKANPNK